MAGADKQTCPGCGASYFASEAACPGCGQVSPLVTARGRRARRVAGARVGFRRLLYLLVLAAAGGLGWWAWSSQPRPAITALQTALRERDGASFVAFCDMTALAEDLWRHDRELAARLAGPLPFRAETRELERRLPAVLAAAVDSGRSLGAWAEAAKPAVARDGTIYRVTRPDDPSGEALLLARGPNRGWRVISLPWRRLSGGET